MQETVDFETRVEEVLFTILYKKAFPSVARYVSRMGGSFEEAKDVFQDALVVYYEKQNSNALNLRNGEKAYLLGIAKHLWSKRYKQKSKFCSFNVNEIEVTSESDKDPSSEKILKFLEASGDKCMNLLKAFYYDKLSLQGIASQFGFSGIRSATVQKYKCLEKVRETIKEKSYDYEDFLD